MKMHVYPCAAALAGAMVLLAGGAAHGALIEVRDGASNELVTNYAGTDDTTLASVSSVSNWAYTNAGGDPNIYSTLHSNRRRALLRFDLSGLAGQTLNGDVTLKLTKSAGPSNILATHTNPVVLLAHPIKAGNAGWVEGTKPYSPSATTSLVDGGEATWSFKSQTSYAIDSTKTAVDNTTGTGTAWLGGPGFGASGNGAATTGVDAAAFTGTYNYLDPAGTVYSMTLPMALVQSWIDTPANNAGLLILTGSASGTASNSTASQFASSENGNAAWRPTLLLDITLPVPEPASVAVLSLAAVGLLPGRSRRASRR